MQTNAAWESPSISLRAGSPATLVDLSSWTLDGVAIGQKCGRIKLTEANGKIVIASTTEFKVALTPADMAQLGAGTVTIEVMRRDPAPVRPIVRLTGQNELGVA
jgi:hypothetical protein